MRVYSVRKRIFRAGEIDLDRTLYFDSWVGVVKYLNRQLESCQIPNPVVHTDMSAIESDGSGYYQLSNNGICQAYRVERLIIRDENGVIGE